MKFQELILKYTRELYTRLAGFPDNRSIDTERVQYFNENANDYIFQELQRALKFGKGLSLCKLGTVELASMVAYLFQTGQVKYGIKEYIQFVKGFPVPMFYEKEIQRLGNNAGVFPVSMDIANRFCSMMLADLQDIDILASYAWCERYLLTAIQHCAMVNLEGYYAPFLYEHPWSKALEGKRVLVIHPFAKSIAQQYEKRALLFQNPNVLPEFASLRVIKAVQSIAETDCGFGNWFEALDYMKEEMEKKDFDIAIIGCGAYGLPLTIHAKKLGKIGIHLAGWTQLLFGIYGKRWLEDQPQYARYINDYWIRPSPSETPKSAKLVEGGCYW
jgi:hypothetical protein